MFLTEKEIVFLFFLVMVLFLVWSYLQICDLFVGRIVYKIFRQKTRTPPQRRMYVGSRVRQSLSQAEPTIYVSPNNLPPPPKYECLAPPSYEEVVGIHYPQYQNQPITQPITVAMAQNTQPSQNVTDAPPAPTVITVTSERTSVQVAASSS
ncbi:uncharacterized protein LOC134678787 isoform X4 [Cydia fagiglandana]|uniref:uncharacterized protein LOC134678787 isoform X4 n=1 Tax=Cydia fagiglandana TaxID=1458189 RepID=UPI002FEE12B6